MSIVYAVRFYVQFMIWSYTSYATLFHFRIIKNTILIIIFSMNPAEHIFRITISVYRWFMHISYAALKQWMNSTNDAKSLWCTSERKYNYVTLIISIRCNFTWTLWWKLTSRIIVIECCVRYVCICGLIVKLANVTSKAQVAYNRIVVSMSSLYSYCDFFVCTSIIACDITFERIMDESVSISN